jgi:hypothetical protein
MLCLFFIFLLPTPSTPLMLLTIISIDVPHELYLANKLSYIVW